MTTDELQAKLQSLVNEVSAKLAEAQKFADEHGLDFEYMPTHLGHYYGKGTPGRYGYEGDESIAEGEWEPSQWNSSSVYC